MGHHLALELALEAPAIEQAPEQAGAPPDPLHDFANHPAGSMASSGIVTLCLYRTAVALSTRGRLHTRLDSSTGRCALATGVPMRTGQRLGIVPASCPGELRWGGDEENVDGQRCDCCVRLSRTPGARLSSPSRLRLPHHPRRRPPPSPWRAASAPSRKRPASTPLPRRTVFVSTGSRARGSASLLDSGWSWWAERPATACRFALDCGRRRPAARAASRGIQRRNRSHASAAAAAQPAASSRSSGLRACGR